METKRHLTEGFLRLSRLERLMRVQELCDLSDEEIQVLSGERALPFSVAEHLIERDFPLPKVTRALAAKQLDILVLGAGSSQLPGPNGVKNAYPARLQAALA